ncbi:hypothetical protein [Estrella lausannensis]|uniref:Uncharacterized protein n=1 Tax=Estrella lausannensis TaxID=483423 RepID=A0A0H5DP00_9BACT|nr:hypothetical protein [Estrella lausannensis]CRX38181.1 hypothetical protein ELAC_0832 [Estrella lausannensis]
MNVGREVSFIQAIQHFEKDISRMEGRNDSLDQLVSECASRIEGNLDLCTLHNHSLLTSISHIKQISESKSSPGAKAKVQAAYNRILSSNTQQFKQEMEDFFSSVRSGGGQIPARLDFIRNSENLNDLSEKLKKYLTTDEGMAFVMAHSDEELLREILFVTEFTPDSPISHKLIQSAIDHDNAAAVRALIGTGVPLRQVMAYISVNSPQTLVISCLKSLIREDASKLGFSKISQSDARISSGPSKPKSDVINYIGSGVEGIKKGSELLEANIKVREEHYENPTKEQKEEIKSQKDLLKRINLVGKTGGFVKALAIALSQNPKLEKELESFVKEKRVLQEELRNNPANAFEIEKKIKAVDENAAAFTHLVVNMQRSQKTSVVEKGIGLATGAIKYAKAADDYLVTMKSLTLIGEAATAWQNWLGYKEGAIKAQHLGQVRNSLHEAIKELVDLKHHYPGNSAIQVLIDLKRQQLTSQLNSLEQEEQQLSRKGYFLIGAAAAGLFSVCAIATAACMYGVKTSEQESNAAELQQNEYALLTVGWGLGLVAKHLPSIPEGKLLGSLIGGKLGEIADKIAQPIWNQGKVSLAHASLLGEKSDLSGRLTQLERAWMDGDRSEETYHSMIQTQQAIDEVNTKIENFELEMKSAKEPSYDSLIKEKKELEELRERLDKAWLEGDRSEVTYEKHTSTNDRLQHLIALIPKTALAQKLGLRVNEVEERLSLIQEALSKDGEEPFLEEFLAGVGVDVLDFRDNPASALLAAFKS